MVINKPDIVTVIQDQDIELKRKGRYFWGSCPFHSEKTPSFMVSPTKQTAHCFGCGFHADVIGFVQAYRDLNFKDALRYLGIWFAGYKPDPRELRKREAIKNFRAWCHDFHNDLCDLVRTLNKAKIECRTVEDVEKIAHFYHEEPHWLNEIEILQDGDDQQKYELYREVMDARV